ncbi:tRNA1(Val) (adenine(37)-N6)-methyltransferase [Geoalkalibacter sp.]|uniref:tRNA1(Val) (adenine(37)-N6)-methyltransferase n=1 Tax=Geoalkalibacter sp. TaxID=3041440 RepID=UPI00272E459E|nr:tRNA1(Val) (adenine(37)-N6)-methyltransferase [Geoalkalibacter sp.]
MTKDSLSEETLDELRIGKLKILQAKNGYRFSLDPVLLCAFARVGKGERVADLGTGSGVMPLILARRSEAEEIVGVEVRADMAARARRSVALNGLEGRIRILEADVREIARSLAPQSFAVVLSNPPFRAPGSGRLAPVGERAAARHELAGGLDDFLRAAAWLLGPGGRFYIIYLAERLADLLEGMRRAGLEPKRLRCVHGRLGEPARMVLVEGRRGGRPGLALEAPLLVFAGEDYTQEVRELYDDEASDLEA